MERRNEEPLSVLIVEDSRTDRLILEKDLVKTGYEVTSSGNGRQALGILQKAYFPIIITDWMMPEMDGIELCRSIRQQVFPGYVYVFLLTAKHSKEDIVRGLEAGADDYLTKPVHSAELIARLNTARRIVSLEQSLRKRNEEIAILSVTDPLTKLYNRSYLSERLPAEFQRTLRYGGSLSILICDIDHFKSVNDRHGHVVGDQVLVEFAARLRQSVREGIDWIVRYGGEEFIMVMPETDIAGAYTVAERCLLRISVEPMPTEAGPVSITASFGVAAIATVDSHETGVDTLIRRADECLYRAKQAGRNRVLCSLEEAGGAKR